MAQTKLVEAVKAFAEEHYEDGGWDVIVECWTDADILEHIGESKTIAQALATFKDLVSIWSDRQSDARIEGGEWHEDKKEGASHE